MMKLNRKTPIWIINVSTMAALQFLLASCTQIPLDPVGAVDSIKTSRHNEAPAFVVIASSRRANGRPVTLTVNNNTDCRISFSLKGTNPKQIWIESKRSEIINFAEGNYEYSVDTRLCTGDVQNLYGKGSFLIAGSKYKLSFSQDDILKGGSLVITNTTDADLQVDIRNSSRTIGVGDKATIPLPEGIHTASIKGRCNNTPLKGVVEVNMTKNSIVGRAIFCTTKIQRTYD